MAPPCTLHYMCDTHAIKMTGGGRNCAVINCGNCDRKLRKWKQTICQQHSPLLGKDCPCMLPYSFHKFPKEVAVTGQWLQALNRKNYRPTKNSFVCSLHFVDGKPTKRNPIPQQNLGYDHPVRNGRKSPKKRTIEEVYSESTESNLNVAAVNQNDDDIFDVQVMEEELVLVADADVRCVCACHNQIKLTATIGTQTSDFVFNEHNYSSSESTLTHSQSTQTDIAPFCSELITSNKLCLFFTGIEYNVFQKLIVTFSSIVNFTFKLPVADQLLLVLMRLRLGLLFMDLALRFGISRQQASLIFNSWKRILAANLKDLIVWLPRDTIRACLPKSFLEIYPRTTCIIDCTEVFIQRPTNLKARAQTWSTYKSHNTAKILVGIAPHGMIMFISSCFGGRASDVFITKNSGLLNNLVPGDEVLADRGFTIADILLPLRVKLNMPAFLKQRRQLTEQETVESRRISSIRIHVERAIARLKSFRVLNSVMQIKTLSDVDDIVLICAALCNLRPLLIKETLH